VANITFRLTAVNAHFAERPNQCPFCGHAFLPKWGTVTNPVRGPQVNHVIVQRYRCCQCAKTFRRYPVGIGRADQSLRLQQFAALIWTLGLSIRHVTGAFQVFQVLRAHMTAHCLLWSICHHSILGIVAAVARLARISAAGHRAFVILIKRSDRPARQNHRRIFRAHPLPVVQPRKVHVRRIGDTAFARWMPNVIADVDDGADTHAPGSCHVHVHQRPALALKIIVAQRHNDAPMFRANHFAGRGGNAPHPRRIATAEHIVWRKVDG
jgi:hypothetical protein